jgi:hypothetical protein
MLLGRNDKIELLRKIPLFAGCTKTELRKLATIADEVNLRKGYLLTREGRLGHEFLVLIEETVRGTRKGRKLADLGAGRLARRDRSSREPHVRPR